MKAFLILENGTVFTGQSVGSTSEVISEIVFNTSMTGYLEVLTDPSYAGQAVVMTYPLIGNYGINKDDMESRKAWPDGFIVREIARRPSNFRCEMSLRDFLVEQEITGITGIDTRALTRILRESGTMNGMITTNEDFVLEEVLPRIREYKQQNVVERTTTISTKVLPGDGCRVALLDMGAKYNIARSRERARLPGYDLSGAYIRTADSGGTSRTASCSAMARAIPRTACQSLTRSARCSIPAFRCSRSVWGIS